MRKVSILIVILFITKISIIFADDSAYSAPFVSLIEIERHSSYLKIKWQDCNDISDEKYRIYRSENPITAVKDSNVELLDEIQPGIQYFQDAALSKKKYYYAVMVYYENKEWWTVQYYRNVTGKSYGLIGQTVYGNSFKDIRLYKDGDKVIITYTLDNWTGEVGLFRSTRPFEMKTDLNNVTLMDQEIGKNGYNEFSDTPIPGIRYYYAMAPLKELREDSFGIEDSLILPGSVLISSSSGTLSNQFINRKTPLPSLLMDFAVPHIDDKMAKPHPLLLDLMRGTNPDSVPEPYLFENRKIRLPSNFKILVNNRSWDKCITYLHEIESTVVKTSKEPYLNFYLSMFYTLSGQREEAFFYLLKCEDLQLQEIQKWKNFIYSFSLSP